MDEELTPAVQDLAQIAVSRYVQFLQELGVPAEKAHEGLQVACESILAEDGGLVFKKVVAWFEEASEGAVKYMPSVRTALAGEFRATAILYAKKRATYPYPNREASLGRRVNQPADPTQQVVICSDVHLGTKASHRKAFFEWLGHCREMTIVLLGDILDLWIYSSTLDDTALAHHVAAEWKDLWHGLHAAVHERHCLVRYVPGNHDAFVYFIESQTQDEWARSIVGRTPLLQAISDLTAKHRLLTLAEIHYPCLRLQVGVTDLVLTHGHYATWGWRLMAGLDDAITPLPSAVAAACVVLAHKNAAELRQLVNQRDWWLNRTHLLEDTALSITNALLRAYDGAWDMMGRSPSDFVALIDSASALYFGARSDVSEVERLRIREALLHLHQGNEHKASDLATVKDTHVQYFNDRRTGTNVRLSTDPSLPTLTTQALSAFATFDEFIFGHFHKPRDGDRMHDVGGFVDTAQTSLHIGATGEVRRDTPR